MMTERHGEPTARKKLYSSRSFKLHGFKTDVLLQQAIDPDHHPRRHVSSVTKQLKQSTVSLFIVMLLSQRHHMHNVRQCM